MAPRRRGKKGTLHYALEVCDYGQLTTIVSSRNDLDNNAGIEVMDCIRRSREIRSRHKISPLQGAVSLGHYNICKHLVEEGAVLKSISCIPHPLCLALQKGHYEIAHLLLKAGADVNLPFGDAMPMSYAVEDKKCTLQIVQDIIAAGFPKNGVINGSSQITTLHLAIKMNHLSIVNYLLSISVDLNVRDVRGLAPIHYAVQKNYPAIVKLLAKNGANLDCECFEHFTPMFYAIATGNSEMVELLISLGADIQYINGSRKCAMTPLHFAANFCQFKIVQFLLENGADVNREIPISGEIPLHSAVRADAQNMQLNKIALDCIVELLIKKGSNLKARQKYGLTPLQVAIKAKNMSAAKILIVNGSELNNGIQENVDYCYTTFHIAAKSFDKELINICLDYGADPHVKDDEGLYPCHLALLTAMLDIMTHGSDCSNSNSSCKKHSQHVPVFKLFWKHGFPFDQTLKMKWLENEVPPYPGRISLLIQKQKMLFTGVKNQQLKTVQKAIAQGAEVRCCSKEMPFPLHYIASKGNEMIMKIFLSKGVLANCIDKRGETALHVAARAGYVNCCRILLEYGAIYNYSSSKCPKTPLELAKDNGHSEVVALLTTVGKYFNDLKKGRFKKLKPDMKIFCAVMNCCGREGMTLMGTAVHLDMLDSAERLMKLRLQMSTSLA